VSAIDVLVRLKGDGSGLVGQMQAVKDALAGVAGAERGASTAAAEVASATTAMAAANGDAATAMRSAAGAANDNAAAMQKAAAGGAQYASMAAQLRSAIDPMYAAQQRFNEQMDAAELLLKEGVIAEREYAAAVEVARQELQKHAQAVAGNGAALAKAAADYAGLLGQLHGALDPMYAAQQQFNQQLDLAEKLLADGTISQRDYAGAVEMARAVLQRQSAAVAGNNAALAEQVAANDKVAAALNNGGTSLAQARAGYINLGRQIQDVAVMAQGGMSLGSIISTQGGQIADAVSQMGGRFAGLAAYMAGPMGTAIIVVTSMLANMAVSMWTAGDASDTAKGKAYDFAAGLDLVKLKGNAAADAMKQLTDATRSAIKVQGDFLAVLGQTATASIDILEKRIADNRAAVKKIQDDWLNVSNLNPVNAVWNYRQIGSLNDQIATDQKALADAREAKTNADLASSQRKVAGELDAATAATDRYNEAVGRLNARYRAQLKDPIGTALAGNGINYEAEFRALTVERDKALDAARDAKKKKKDNTASLANFGEDTGSRISSITDQFSDLPPAVEKANKALRDLDAIIGDVERKGDKLGAGPKLIAEATAAKAKVQAGLSKTLTDQIGTIGAPYTVSVSGQTAALKALGEISRIVDYVSAHSGQIINSGQILADAAKAKVAIEDSLNKPFADYMRTATEAAAVDKLLVAGRDDEAAALKVVLGLQKQQGPLTQEQTAAVLATVSAQRQSAMVLRDQKALIQANVQAAQSLRTALVDSVSEALKGRATFDKILSNVGGSYLNIMSQRIVESMFGDSLRAFEDEATRNFRSATDATATKITGLGDVVGEAMAKISAASGAMLSVGTGPVFASAPTFEQFAASVRPAGTSQDITVTAPGKKAEATPATPDVSGALSPLLGQLNSTFKGLTGVSLPKTILDGMKPTFGKLEEVLPGALQGAFTGSAASKLILGSGSSSIGGGIGGAIGETMGKKFLSKGLETISSGLGAAAGPLGGMIGGVIGGMLGDLLTTAKAGTTVITGVGKASTTASTSDVASGLTTMGNSVGTSLTTIANKFGTTVGDFAVSIGQYKDNYRVSASGSSRVGDKYYPNSAGSDILYDGTDSNQAALVAIQNAIADGAVRGLSKAVQKALASSTNIENAVSEALKVQQVELAIGGVGASMEKSMREAQAAAEDRLRIAKDYGFDMVAVEKVNAESRLKLQQDLLAKQVASVQTLLDEMSSGSLFEGSLVDQRAAILAKITTAKADVAAGKDGASDTLAKLLEQLNTVSKEAYGTSSAYAADRALIEELARDTIAQTNKQISDAQATVDAQTAVDALATTNEQLDESNDTLAEIASTLDITLKVLQQIFADGGSITSSTLIGLAKTS